MQAHVVVVGSYNQDHAWRVDRVPAPGETRRGHGFVTGPGGKGFNQAVGCARQDVSTHFIGARGTDALGEGARALAEREGITGHWQCVEQAPTGTACIVVDDSGQNQIVVDLAANNHLSADFVRQHASVFDDAAALLVQLESPLEAVHAALELAGEKGVPRILNPAPMHAGLDAELLQHVDVLTPNEGEFAALCRQLLDIEVSTEEVAVMDGLSLHALTRRLGVCTVVITLGARGCFVSHGARGRSDDITFAYLDAEAVTPVDTTAAGDAFCGALGAGLARLAGAPFSEIVRYANRVAAMTTERPGAAASIPRHDEVMARFDG